MKNLLIGIELSDLELNPCPWCNQTPLYVRDSRGVEIWCTYKFCRANPHISLMKGYSKAQVTVVWNSYTKSEEIKEKNKNPPKDLRKFKEYLSKKELCSILIDAKSSEELWDTHLPEYKFMTQQKKEDNSHGF